LPHATSEAIAESAERAKQGVEAISPPINGKRLDRKVHLPETANHSGHIHCPMLLIASVHRAAGSRLAHDRVFEGVVGIAFELDAACQDTEACK
jgi:hypothetical protein